LLVSSPLLPLGLLQLSPQLLNPLLLLLWLLSCLLFDWPIHKHGAQFKLFGVTID
jgi:hypothetical protein